MKEQTCNHASAVAFRRPPDREAPPGSTGKKAIDEATRFDLRQADQGGGKRRGEGMFSARWC